MASDANRHEGKVVLVTGGASGIGKGNCRTLPGRRRQCGVFDLNETVTDARAGRFLSLRGDSRQRDGCGQRRRPARSTPSAASSSWSAMLA